MPNIMLENLILPVIRSKAFLLAAVAGGVVMWTSCQSANPLFEFCTTKAYGWPFPWKMDYCPCSGGRVMHHPGYWISNAAILGFASLLAGLCFPRGSDTTRHGTPNESADTGSEPDPPCVN